MLAHDPAAYRALGRLVAAAKGQPRAEVSSEYGQAFMRGLAKLATPGKHANVLQHMAGYFKDLLPHEEKRELHAAERGWVDDVAGGHLDPGEPGSAGEPRRVAGEDAHAAPGGQQPRHEPPPDVPGCSRDQDHVGSPNAQGFSARGDRAAPCARGFRRRPIRSSHAVEARGSWSSALELIIT
ncbi:MAG TPA: YbgA family protein [Anaeromyxobacteraceae bacterium]|nr:YbgA family protein [Anaeromyxobacteraceae bacterium]